MYIISVLHSDKVGDLKPQIGSSVVWQKHAEPCFSVEQAMLCCVTVAQALKPLEANVICNIGLYK